MYIWVVGGCFYGMKSIVSCGKRLFSLGYSLIALLTNLNSADLIISLDTAWILPEYQKYMKKKKIVSGDDGRILELFLLLVLF